jgi:hypothetical protein
MISAALKPINVTSTGTKCCWGESKAVKDQVANVNVVARMAALMEEHMERVRQVMKEM